MISMSNIVRNIMINLITIVSLLYIGTTEKYKIEILGHEGTLFIFILSLLLGLNLMLTVSKGSSIYMKYSMNYVYIVLNTVVTLFLGGLLLLSYKLWLLESWNSNKNTLVLGMIGLSITRIWLTEEKLEAIEYYWRKNNESYIYDLLLRLNEVSSGLELTQRLKENLLGYSCPYEIKCAIKIYFELKKQEHIKEMAHSWNDVMLNLGKNIYNFVVSPLGLALIGIVGVMFYYNYSIGSLKWLVRDYKNEALSDLHDGASHLATATYVLNKRVDDLYNRTEGINEEITSSQETVCNAMKSLNEKINNLTYVLSEEESKIGFLKQLLGKGEEVGSIAAEILLDNTVLQELDILREIMKDKKFGESFMARLVDILSDNGYEENKPTKVPFPGIGKKLGEKN